MRIFELKPLRTDIVNNKKKIQKYGKLKCDVMFDIKRVQISGNRWLPNERV